MPIASEFAHIFGDAEDYAPDNLPSDEAGGCDAPDPIGKFFREAECAATLHGSPDASLRHIHNLAEESAPLDAHVNGIYKSLAADAEKKNPPARSADTLEKAAYKVGDERLSKSEVSSRMLGVLSEIRAFCLGDEEKQIEKAINCLDFALFGQLCKPVLERLRCMAART
jgi:hypothetical protein